MTLTAVLLFAASLGILVFILKYRIHVHVTYQPSRRGATAGTPPRNDPGRLFSKSPARATIRRDSTSCRRSESVDGFSPKPLLTSDRSRQETSQRSFAPNLQALKQAGEPKTSGEAAGSLALDIKSALVNLGCKPKRASEVAARISQHFTAQDFDRALRVAIREAA
jgi:hypothetical protein